MLMKNDLTPCNLNASISYIISFSFFNQAELIVYTQLFRWTRSLLVFPNLNSNIINRHMLGNETKALKTSTINDIQRTL